MIKYFIDPHKSNNWVDWRGRQDYTTSLLQGGIHYITSDYGNRDDPFGMIAGEVFHNGIDVKATTKTGKDAADLILAYDDGVVSYTSDTSSSCGTYVVIHHGDRLYTRYLHMEEGTRQVNVGDRVKKGQVIGRMGTSGNSTGVHLHFDITNAGLNSSGYVKDPTNRNDPNEYLLKDTSPIPPEITTITQLSSTKVQIEGNTNGHPSIGLHTRCYYKWDKSIDIEKGDYDGVVSGTDSFRLEIDKPRKATHISVIPVQMSDDKEPIVGVVKDTQLQCSYPCVQILTDKNEALNATPHIYKDGQWQEVVPTIRTDNSWYELYNTDKERVK